MRQTRGLVHLKTAGTSYLEALRTAAAIDPALFRRIYAFSRDRYPTDRASYHVSAELAKAPPAGEVGNGEFVALIDQFDAREILHVTFGSVLTAKGPDRETQAETTYRANLGRYVNEAWAIGATPVIVTPLPRRFFGGDNRVHSDLGAYVEAAKGVAREKGAPLVDLHARSIDLFDRLGLEAAHQLGAVKTDGTVDELGRNVTFAIETLDIRSALGDATAQSRSPCVVLPGGNLGGSRIAGA
jgi:tagaturonate epimerase